MALTLPERLEKFAHLCDEASRVTVTPTSDHLTGLAEIAEQLIRAQWAGYATDIREAARIIRTVDGFIAYTAKGFDR